MAAVTPTRCSGRRAPGSAGAGASDVLLRRRRRRPLGRGRARRRRAAGRCERARRPGAAGPRRRAQPRLPARLRRPRRTPRRRRTTTSGRGATACTRVALRITPEQLRAIAAQLYVELLRRRLHAGLRVPLPAARPTTAAATPIRRRWRTRSPTRPREAGIGLTLLPVLYERAGFARRALRADQRRFATTADDVLALQRDASRAAGRSSTPASRSTRCAPRAPESIARARAADGSAGPMHIHVAEQTAEVDDCLAATGCAADRVARARTRRSTRAGSWCTPRTPSPAEIDAVAAQRRRRRALSRAPRPISATASPICPAGSPPACRWRSARTARSTRAWPEELRWLEYGQRLGLRRRNVAAAPGVEPSTAARLFERVSAGGAAAAGLARWGLQPRCARRPARARPARPGAARPAAGSPARRRRLRRAGAPLRARDGRRTLAQRCTTKASRRASTPRCRRCGRPASGQRPRVDRRDTTGLPMCADKRRDWFRHTDWNAEIEADFERHLRRARDKVWLLATLPAP